jgi:hypothetical protein
MDILHPDVNNASLDIGDIVRFATSGNTGNIFKIVNFTLNGDKALIANGRNQTYWVPTQQLKWVR